MATDGHFDESVSRWLEETAPARLPERVLDATFERTRVSRQHNGWRALLKRFHITRFAPALGGAAVVVIAAALALGLYANRPGVGGPVAPVPTESSTPAPSDGQAAGFAGNWEATDFPPDLSHLTMAIVARPNGTFGLTILDDGASVCGGASSTMTGVAEAGEPGTIVIEQPEYTCDDGSEAEALSGPPLEEQLQNLAFVYDPGSDALQDSFGLVWSRRVAAPIPTESSTPAPSDGDPVAFDGNWQATDPPPDSSHLTMELIALPNGTYGVTIRDDLASVCGGVSSTMTGVAEAQEPGTIVIQQPEYVCDDGSEAQALSGPPLEEQLRNLSYTYDSQRDELEDSFGLVWHRESTQKPTPTEQPSAGGGPAEGQSAGFAGNWEATDMPPDLSHLTMAIVARPNGTFGLTIGDDFASVCSGASSTMTGVAEERELGTIVIEQPDYACDDGSEAQALSGPPLLEQLRNLGFTYDPGSDELQDSFGLVWSRVAMGP